MARICGPCGRDVYDERYHELVELEPVAGFKLCPIRVCKMTLVVQNAGRTSVPLEHTGRREAGNNARYVHDERLQAGGDLV